MNLSQCFKCVLGTFLLTFGFLLVFFDENVIVNKKPVRTFWIESDSLNVSDYVMPSFETAIATPSRFSNKTAIFVTSAIYNYDLRSAIRSSWGQPEQLKQFNMSLTFVLGLPQSKTDLHRTLEESKIHQDMLIGDIFN